MILKVKDENGQFKEVVLKGLKGEKGDRGEDGTVLQQKEIDDIKSSLDNIVSVYDAKTTLTDFINNTKSNIVEVGDVEENDIIINKNNLELVVKGVIKTNNLIINGNNTGLTFKGGKIVGDLNICKTTRTTLNGSNILFFDNGHNFKVGDLVSSSYGLGGDGKNHAEVINIDDVSITVDKNTHSELAEGVDIGNFTWSSLLNLRGDNNYINNLAIENSRGYILSSTNNTTINGGYLKNIGLDIALLENGIVTLNNVNIGNIIDCAKSGFVLKGCTLILNDCIMDKNNSDADFVIYNSDNKSNIFANRCEFRSNNNHLAPFNYKKFALISVQSLNNNKVVGDIVFNNCKIGESVHGLMHKENDDYFPIIENINFNNCFINSCIGELRYFDFYNFNIDKCDVYDVIEPGKVFVLNNNKNLNINNCKFTNINCDFCLAFNTFNSKFYNSKLKYVSEFILNGLELNDSTMSCANAYENNKSMFVDNLIINDTNFSLLNMGGDVSNILALNQDNTILKFKYPNSNNEYYVYNHVGRTFYNSKMFTAFNKLPNFNRYDYLISNDSIIYDVATHETRKVINSELKIKNSIQDNKIYIDTDRIAIGDYVNTLTLNSYVMTYKVISVESGYIVCDSYVHDCYENICVFRLDS